MKRQNLRKFLLILALLLFPVTLYYFSPALIINAAFHHIVNGSFIVFALMFVLSIPFGRLFCGWFCPAGGLQECLYAVNEKVRKPDWKDWVKFGIWGIWLAFVIFCYVTNGGIRDVDPLYETDHGISVMSLQSYVIYYGILLLVIIPALIGGKRTFCRCFCWMAPFMILGSALRRKLDLPGLHVRARSGCVGCGSCSRQCPMGIDVKGAALREGTISSGECILCGGCIDGCPKHILTYAMRREAKDDRKEG